MERSSQHRPKRTAKVGVDCEKTVKTLQAMAAECDTDDEIKFVCQRSDTEGHHILVGNGRSHALFDHSKGPFGPLERPFSDFI